MPQKTPINTQHYLKNTKKHLPPSNTKTLNLAILNQVEKNENIICQKSSNRFLRPKKVT